MDNTVLIDHIYLLVAAIVRQATTDANLDRRISREFSRTCEATAHNHPARTCAQEFFLFMEEYKTGTDWSAADYCFGVIKLWQQ